MRFRLHPIRFYFIARESVHFAEGQSANTLRGAFGATLRRIACKPQCARARDCEWRASCAYARIFEPSATIPGPSGLADWPRPFVFRAMHLDGLTITSGSAFHFDLNLFDTATGAIAPLIAAFAEFSHDGLGPSRGRAELTGISQLDASGEPAARLYEDGPRCALHEVQPLELDLNPPEQTASSLRVRFLTPTELKSGQQIAEEPHFRLLAARVRDRISTLSELYGEGALPIDFRAFSQRAALVRMTRYETRNVSVSRRSSRTGQVHSIGGFIGEAEYQGELTEFLPFLKAAEWTGVGRQTVWGKGQVAVH